jgi:solute carrier family 10 (sodium/bile acid cotransporter), member 7
MAIATPKLDRFSLVLVATVAVASVLPCRGDVAQAFARLTYAAVVALFFMHGARLPRRAVLEALQHWRLHLVVLAATFVMFPLLGLGLRQLTGPFLGEPLAAGLLFLCAVPSTVQSSIAFTSLARGNVAGAVCSAAASSLLGVVLTPLIDEALGLRASGGASLASAALNVVQQLLLPFALGHLAQDRLRGVIERHPRALRVLDQGSIALAVYTTFSAAVVQGLWQRLPLHALLLTAVLTAVLLALALLITWRSSRLLGFSRPDEIVVVFCGSKKSLASGVPLANVLFPAPAIGVMVLPLMIYHQLQLIVCAMLAQAYAARAGSEPYDGDGKLTSARSLSS